MLPQQELILPAYMHLLQELLLPVRIFLQQEQVHTPVQQAQLPVQLFLQWSESFQVLRLFLQAC